MSFKDRVKEFRRVKASELVPHPKNWRSHPDAQRSGLKAVLDEIGFADALLVRERVDGSLELIDGHLRAEISSDAEVPVLVLDLDEKEAELLLTVYDPLSSLADTDESLWDELRCSIETENEELRALLERLGDEDGLDEPSAAIDEPKEASIPNLFQVVIDCRDEDEQRELYERMTSEGLKCRVLTL